MTTYKESGVDIETGTKAVSKISKLVKSTFTANTLTEIGGFGGCFEFPKNDYDTPVLVSSADGIGTKLKIAFLANKHDTIGQCLVNHCTNDILAVGAKPLFFLDYFATAKLEVDVLESVVSGLSKACIENSCSLIGGETAEMPGFYQTGEYDMSGTIIGVVDKNNMLPNRKTKSGDVLIGLKSTGLHTNGYSLARKVLLGHFDVDDYVDQLGCTLQESLLAIHRSYLPIIEPILEKDWLISLSHITGGGIVDNTMRVIGENQNISIDWDAWEWPTIFSLIQDLGNVPTDDMRHSMNLGIGLIIIVRKENVSDLEKHLQSNNEPYYHLGTVV